MSKISQWFFLLFCFFLVTSNSLWADPPPLEPSGNTVISEASLALPEIVVTANRLATPVSQVANSMTVITAQQLERTQARTTEDALQGVPGLSLLQNGAVGENSGLFIRGADAGHTLVLLDGVPLNNSMETTRGFTGWDQLFVDDVDRIEVVRGPLSTIYGTNATAGVVNILTQKGGETPKGSFLFEGGTYQSLREAATASVGNSFGNLALSLSRFDTQGFPSADKSLGNGVNSVDGNTTASLHLGIAPASNLDNGMIVRYSQSLTNLPAQGGAGGDDPNYFLNERQWVAGNQLKWKLLGGDWEQILGLSYINDLQLFSDDFSSYPNSHYERGAFEGQTAQVFWQNNLKLGSGETLITGIQSQQEWGRQDDTYGIIGDYGFGPVTTLTDTLIDKTDTTVSYFMESQTALADRLFATLGGRLDAVSSFGDTFTYRGAVAYFVPTLETKLKATYGTGFKAPSLYQLYSPYGTPTLQAEKSEGWDLGLEQAFGKSGITAGTTYFWNDFTNLIDFNDSTFVYQNFATARTQGWETFASAHLLGHLDCRADYTYTWAVNLETGNQLIRRPQNQANFNASYQLDAANFGFNAIYVGDRPDLAFLNFTSTPVTLPSYILVNLMASYQVDEHLKFFGRINNLFNAVYEEVYGYGTPGFSVYAGTKISL